MLYITNVYSYDYDNTAVESKLLAFDYFDNNANQTNRFQPFPTITDAFSQFSHKNKSNRIPFRDFDFEFRLRAKSHKIL